ncbi:MAG: helix-turn-helix transcriptional regulator [Ruthenibacterium sp.]
MNTNDMSFGDFIESIRRASGNSLRETAKAIGISPQFYSEVEKNRRCAFTSDRLDKLRAFLGMTEEQATEMYNKAAESRKGKNVTVPQDFSDYIVERDYAMQALRLAKELGADEQDWEKFTEDLKRRKEQ